MSTDKTLADVQPGGRVRLGEQAAPSKDGWNVLARIDTAIGYLTTALDDLESCPDRRPGIMVTEAMAVLRETLSAQPSPGGQGGDDIEQLRVQLAGCGVVALSNTRESLKEQMPEKGAYGWSESLLQVRESVLREIHQRERAEAAEQALEMAASTLPTDVLQKIAAFFYDGPYRNHKMVSVMEAALAARQPVGISAEWVLGYLTTDAPEDSREAIRNAFAEYAALSGARQPVGEQ